MKENNEKGSEREYKDACIPTFEELLHQMLMDREQFDGFYEYLFLHYRNHLHHYASKIYDLTKKNTKEKMMEFGDTAMPEDYVELQACQSSFLSWLRTEYLWYEGS